MGEAAISHQRQTPGYRKTDQTGRAKLEKLATAHHAEASNGRPPARGALEANAREA